MASKDVRSILVGEYRDALRDSPKWIKDAFNAFLTLPDEYVQTRPFLYYVLDQGTPNFKMSKELSAYGNPPMKGQTCGNCRFAYQKVVADPPRFICAKIRGKIEPELWCKLWKAGK